MTRGNPDVDELASDRLIRPDWATGPSARGGDAFSAAVESVRQLQDRLAASHAPVEVLHEVCVRLKQAAALLATWKVPEEERPFGRRWDLAGRGQFLTPPLSVVERSDHHLAATMRLGEQYLGRNGAAHGGVIPLVFDEIMGAVANLRSTDIFRTAYLNVNFRVITPIGPELRIDSVITREDGRKRFISGTLRRGNVLLADAEGLFIALRAGQP